MRHLILLFFLVIPGMTFCQDTIPVHKKKFAEGLIFAPEYAFRSMKLTGEVMPNTQANFDLQNSMEIPKFGFTTGFGFVYEFGERFGFETGILFSSKGEKTKSLTDLFRSPDGKPYEEINYTYTYQYFCLPVKVRFNVITTPVRLFISAGISTNMLLAAKSRMFARYLNGSTYSYVENYTSHFESFNFQLLCSTGIEFTPGNRIRLRFEPIYSRSLNSIITGQIKEYLWSAGAVVGVYYTF